MAELIKIAGVQMDVRFADFKENLNRLVSSLTETADRGARLTVFPECVLTGYCFESLEEAMPLGQTVPGPATDEVAAVCDRLDTYTVFGLLERDGARLFNACVLVGPGGVIGSYRKVHLPYLGIDRFVSAGDRPFALQQIGDLQLGMNICYDGAFPEAARVMALAGADLIVLPTNWPPGAECFAKFVVNARAMENCVFYCAVNRVGKERGFRFIGNSRICDTDGNTIVEADQEEEQILYADIDFDRARNKHLVRVRDKHEINRFADRRPEMYQSIADPVRDPYLQGPHALSKRAGGQ